MNGGEKYGTEEEQNKKWTGERRKKTGDEIDGGTLFTSIIYTCVFMI